jgi:hypothetical protein
MELERRYSFLFVYINCSHVPSILKCKLLMSAAMFALSLSDVFIISLIRAIKPYFPPRFVGARPRSRGKTPVLDRMSESPPRPPSALPDRLVKSPTFVSEKTYKPCNSKRPSTSRTYLSSLSNHVDIKIRDSEVKAGPGKSALINMEPAFVDVCKDAPGLSVWRLEVTIRNNHLMIHISAGK